MNGLQGMQEMEQKGSKVKVTEAALALPLLPETTALNPAATCTDVDHFLHPLPEPHHPPCCSSFPECQKYAGVTELHLARFPPG